MTRIDFHLNVTDSLQYTCRLVRKVHALGTKVVCYSRNASTLQTLDTLLWTFSAGDFLPHVQHGHEGLADTPIVLTHSADDVHHHDLLINLDDEWPPFFARFDRLVEIVNQDEQAKMQARQRYKFYKTRGYPLNTFDLEKTQKGQR